MRAPGLTNTHSPWARMARAGLQLVLVMALLAPFLVAPAAAAQTPAAGQPAAPPSVSAAAWILVDLSTGQVVASQQPHARLAIASLTKVMTAVVALRYGALADELTVDGRDLPGEASIGLKAGERLSLETLLYGLLMRSGNDAAAVIARGVGAKAAAARGFQSDGAALFLDLMNEQAASLGMNNTQFRNPHGLDAPEHFSSAYDLALLTQHALKDERFAAMFGARSYPFRGGIWPNVNRLLYQYEGLIGGKTGVETNSGLCLIEVAQRGERRLAVVVLNAPQWYDDAGALLDYGFGDGRALPPTQLTTFGAPSPSQGTVPAPAASAAPAPPPTAVAIGSGSPVGAPAPAGSPPTIGPIEPTAPVAAPRQPDLSGGASDDLAAQGGIPAFAAQAPEGDWSSPLVIGLLIGGSVAALALIGYTLRALRVGPFRRSRWAAMEKRKQAPWRTYDVAATPDRPPPRRQSTSPARAPDPAESTAGAAPGQPAPTPAPTADETTERVIDHLSVALRHVKGGRIDTAESFFIKAIQIAPDFRFSTVPNFWTMSADGYVALALAYRRCNQPVQARSVVALGLLRYPEHPDLRSLDRRLQGERRRP
jgi:D-alanyl-D-alanine carboxypeptidase